jgi:hypothetical protein
MIIEVMLVSGIGFSAVCGVALSGAVDKGAEKLGMCVPFFLVLIPCLPCTAGGARRGCLLRAALSALSPATPHGVPCRLTRMPLRGE